MKSLLFSPGRGRTREPDHLTLQIDGGPCRIALRRNVRARRYSLRVPAAGGDPVLTLPARGRLEDAIPFLERHKAWLAARLARQPERIPFVAGALVPLRGEPHRIVHQPDLRGTCWTAPVPGGALLCVAGSAEHLARRVADFLKREARRDLEAAVARAAAGLGKPHGRVRLKDTRSRWGSCSASGDLMFSWRIILAPPFVLDYLAAHEVAHLQEMNHGPAFWRVVRDLCPTTESARVWLRVNGARLHAYG